LAPVKVDIIQARSGGPTGAKSIRLNSFKPSPGIYCQSARSLNRWGRDPSMTRHEIVRFLRNSALRGVVTLMVATVTGMAQTGGGATLVGTVKDATGATVGGAKVTVVNTATAFITETTTSAEGAYYVPYLTPGDYRVKVSSAGFKEFVREGIT